jgi:hypothetical protein
MANIYDMADTWNDVGTVFTAIKMNVTNTASAAASLLMDLQVGGSSKFSVDKNGSTLLGAVRYSSSLFFGIGATNYQGFTSTGIIVRQGTSYQFASAGVGGVDLVLARDDAGILAQRNGTNPQEFRLYNTYTDASNYERGFMRWNSNVLEIGTEADGTGTVRELKVANNLKVNGTVASEGGAGFKASTTSQFFYWDSLFIRKEAASILKIDDNTNGAAIQLEEMTAPSAPAADNVRIYAEDNGSGKTRLMALFPTGAAQQIAIEP